jgi:hypothetical protein
MSAVNSRHPVMTVILPIASALVVLYGIESLLTFASPDFVDRFAVTLRRGPTVIAETVRMRRRGIAAVPFLQSDTFTDSAGMHLRLPGDTAVAPLSGIPSALTILCNESGITIGYRSDSLGFRNPADAWSATNPDVALIGDSFAHGFCRPQQETIAYHIHRAGFQTINAGVTGAGPLTELAILREYVRPAHPRVVFWLFYEGNDLIDLESEKQTVLRNYLQPAFTQKLIARKAEIGAAMKIFAESRINAYRPPGALNAITGFLSLRQLRSATGLTRDPRVFVDAQEEPRSSC